MTVLDCILNGVEAELALERELGVRCVDCSRDVLDVQVRKGPDASRPAPVPQPVPAPVPQPPEPQTAKTVCLDFAFLHDRALSDDGVAMMAKIVLAMGKTPETAPVLVEGKLPSARAYVVLGAKALKKWFPGTAGAPGQWVRTTAAPNVLVTYSPEYILRFASAVTVVRSLKREMWTSLKSVMQRVKSTTEVLK